MSGMQTSLRLPLALGVLLLAACDRAPVPATQQPASAAAEAAAPAAATPAEVVGSLYSALRSTGLRGAPTAEQLAQIERWLDPSLRDLLREARRVHDEARAAAPTEKPPFNDGDQITSLFEGPSGFQVIAVEAPAQDASRRVTVSFTYGALPNVTRWQDYVIVKPGEGGFRVVDVQYGGNWEFGNRGTLVQSLRAGLAPAGAPAP
jgi:hypothetical protein